MAERLRDNQAELRRRVRRARVVPLIRTREAATARRVGGTLIAAGATVLEVALTCPDAPAVLRALSPADCLVGAASVADEESLRAALEAGADFAVSAHLDRRLIEVCQAAGRPFIPGAATPTEICAAVESGAELVKVFPARQLGGPAYLRSLLGPLPGLRLLPAGGIALEEIDDYLAAGAWGVVVGNALIGAAEPSAAYTELQRRLSAERSGAGGGS
ncbi:MAG: bifunctional 4-hydroxy-2-oxoglutarate aldolase/2-dehydro-3-deoxy-phosphogluconate aldolase [Candidatus Coatesbacteria bacterium]|nr:bifunctional 4-hydroxy-2-oxoglutarate aldolase/2-dehydro-3-deoxy-phosphogluconate aldolase [Candidatus Coatesbacteria bacterium]